MKKILLILMISWVAGSHTQAQEVSGQAYNIIFQMVTDDTLAHKAFMKQLNNILSTAPETKIEVVCHGPALNMLHKDRSIVGTRIEYFLTKGVVFHACEFSMSERNVQKDQILPGVTYVKAGILAIVEKQSQGWHYIKAGF